MSEARPSLPSLPRPSDWRLLRHLYRTHVSGLLFLSVLFAIVVAGIIAAIGAFGTVEHSVWEGASQVPRWYILVMGVLLTCQYLPLYLIHGETRRDFMVSAVYFTLAFTGVAAAGMTLGFGLEGLVYRILDWPHVRPPEAEGLFDAPDQLGLIFPTFWLVFLVWMVVGELVAAAFYRRAWEGLGGFLLIPLGLVMVTSAETAVHSRSVPSPLLAAVNLEDTPALLAVGLCLTSVATGLGLTWAFVRDIPVRNKTA